MHDIVTLLDGHMYVVVVSVICLAVLANSLLRAMTSILTTQTTERSRREIAAYVSAGSISPAQGQRRARSACPAPSRLSRPPSPLSMAIVMSSSRADSLFGSKRTVPVILLNRPQNMLAPCRTRNSAIEWVGSIENVSAFDLPSSSALALDFDSDCGAGSSSAPAGAPMPYIKPADNRITGYKRRAFITALSAVFGGSILTL